MEIPESRRWHASWIIAAIIALGVGWITTGTGLEMTPLIVIISLTWILLSALLWLATSWSKHVLAKVLLEGVLTVCSGFAIWWVYSYDRPILFPQIGGVLSQNYNISAFGLDIETLVKNVGRQSGYAEKWNLALVIDGVSIEGREIYGQPLPPNAVNEPEMYNQEFPPGKPVRGWLFWGFPAVSHEYAAPYFTCGSPLMNKVRLRLSAWDSKAGREWTQVLSLKDLGKEACAPLQAPKAPEPFVKVKPLLKPITPKIPVDSSPKVFVNGSVSQTSTGDCTANVVGGNANLNCESTPPARTIPPEHYRQIRDYLAESPGTVIVSASGGIETYDFAQSLYLLLKDAGWKMQDGAVRSTQILGSPWRGVVVKYRGAPIPLGQQVLITGSKPEDRIGQVLGALKLKPSADRNENYPDGVIEIEVGDQPRHSDGQGH